MTNETVSFSTCRITTNKICLDKIRLDEGSFDLDTRLILDTARATFRQRLAFVLAWLVRGKASIPWGPKENKDKEVA